MTGTLIFLGVIMINVIMGGLMTYRQYKIDTFRYREENKKFISYDKTPILYESYKGSLSEYCLFAFSWLFNVFDAPQHQAYKEIKYVNHKKDLAKAWDNRAKLIETVDSDVQEQKLRREAVLSGCHITYDSTVDGELQCYICRKSDRSVHREVFKTVSGVYVHKHCLFADLEDPYK